MTFSKFISSLMGTPEHFIINIIDIAVVAYIIYYLLKLVAKTRAAHVLRGMAFLLIIYIFAKYFELQMMGWILDKVWLMLTVAIPIVFQQELRSLLEKLGEGSLSRFRVRNNTNIGKHAGLVAELIEMAETLSKERIGALVVVERKVRIDEHLLVTGTEIDAKVSAPLLINIFEPNTPLHDGAVIIRDNRVYRAATVLPLTSNNDIDRELGTRHRAGIGISELTDSVVLIVSEETGIISVSSEGKIERFLHDEKLQNKLMKELAIEEKQDISISVLDRLKGIAYGFKKENKS